MDISTVHHIEIHLNNSETESIRYDDTTGDTSEPLKYLK